MLAELILSCLFSVVSPDTPRLFIFERALVQPIFGEITRYEEIDSPLKVLRGNENLQKGQLEKVKKILEEKWLRFFAQSSVVLMRLKLSARPETIFESNLLRVSKGGQLTACGIKMSVGLHTFIISGDELSNIYSQAAAGEEIIISFKIERIETRKNGINANELVLEFLDFYIKDVGVEGKIINGRVIPRKEN